jgi:hypothetical protein
LRNDRNENEAFKFSLQAFVDVMCFQESVMGILVEVNGDLFFEGGLEFPLKIGNEITNPAVVLVVLLAVADKNVVFETWNDRGHPLNILQREEIGDKEIRE